MGESETHLREAQKDIESIDKCLGKTERLWKCLEGSTTLHNATMLINIRNIREKIAGIVQRLHQEV